MKLLIATLVLTAAACAHEPDASSAASVRSQGVRRPAAAITVNGADAAALVKILDDAGVPKLSAIESTSWASSKIECSRTFAAASALVSECTIAVAAASRPGAGVQRPAAALTLNGRAAERLINFLAKQAGVPAVSAIESTSWTTAAVSCTRTFKNQSALIAECSVGLTAP